MLCTGDEIVPGYRLEGAIGSGSFGEVWKVRGPGGTLAALKFINLRADHGPKELRAIERIKAIRCAHLMPITAIWLLDQSGRALDNEEAIRCLAQKTVSLAAFDGGEVVPVTLVVAMPLGDQSLADRLRECRAAGLEGIPLPELLEYIDDVAQGIDYLNAPRHELGDGPVGGVQHGDVKPRNIILMGGAAQLCDFGLARVLGESATATCMGGTPAYLAPECLRDRRYSHTTDQYSLAISYHELRTGRLPFEADSVSSILEIHKHSRLDLDRLPPPERAVVRRATLLDPSERYRTCQEFARALREAARATGVPPAFAICSAVVPPAEISGAGVSPAAEVCSAGVPPAPICSVVIPPSHEQDDAASCETPVDGSISSTPVDSTLQTPVGQAFQPDSSSPIRRPMLRRTKAATLLGLLVLLSGAILFAPIVRNGWRPDVANPPAAPGPGEDHRRPHRVPARGWREGTHHAERDAYGSSARIAPPTEPVPTQEATDPSSDGSTSQPADGAPPPAEAPPTSSEPTSPEASALVVPPAMETDDSTPGEPPMPNRPGDDAPADTGGPARPPAAAVDRPSPVPFPGDQLFNDQPPFQASVTVDHADLFYREGDRLRIEFQADREAHLYLLYHQADGQSRLLFPNPSQRDNRLPAKQPVAIPSADQPLRFRIGPPFGTEVLQVLATLQPAPELDALLGGAANTGRQNEAGPAALAPLATAPMISQKLLDELRARLLKDKTIWTEHRVVLRTEGKVGAPPPRKTHKGEE